MIIILNMQNQCLRKLSILRYVCLPVTLFLFGYELSLTINCVKLMDGLVTGCLSGQSVCCSCSSWKKMFFLYGEASYRYFQFQSIRKSPLEKIHTFLLQSVIENGRSASPSPPLKYLKYTFRALYINYDQLIFLLNCYNCSI